MSDHSSSECGKSWADRRASRIRVETDTVGPANMDVVVPCFLVVVPDMETDGLLRMAAQHANQEQLAELVAAAIRYGHAAGVMGKVFASLLSSPNKVELEFPPPKPPGTPLDDMPPHMRTPPPPSPGSGP